MKTTAIERAKRFPLGWTAAAILGCLLFGAALAALTRPASLLASAPSGPPKRDTVWEQLYHAKQVDTEAAWRAVLAYFPEASVYQQNLAKQGLVYYYIRTRQYDKAVKPLEELAAQPDFQAFGIAGLVVVYASRGEDDKAHDENQRLTTEMRSSLGQQAPQMADWLHRALDELAGRAL